MKTEQRRWDETGGWRTTSLKAPQFEAHLVFAFGGRCVLEEKSRFDEIKAFYPDAEIVLCSTAGEITGREVIDNSIVVTALNFESSRIRTFSLQIDSIYSSYEIGKRIAAEFPCDGLKHLFILSDGQKVNGSRLVKGMNDVLPSHISVTGGLAGDGSLFRKTIVGLNDYPEEGRIAAVGFYGSNLKINCGSIGGWNPFGPEREITKSKDNVLYELDGQSALELYKKYLGNRADELPGSALLFPLSIKINENSEPVVRTILSIDEENNSMVFAGDMPEGAYARLMKANFDKLIEGAEMAAENCITDAGGVSPELAILISCVGRKLVLGQRVEEEVESVKAALGEKTEITGFYSYGEIAPFKQFTTCELHNQTMTVTTFTESPRNE